LISTSRGRGKSPSTSRQGARATSAFAPNLIERQLRHRARSIRGAVERRIMDDHGDAIATQADVHLEGVRAKFEPQAK
jgi:hypothetical protein